MNELTRNNIKKKRLHRRIAGLISLLVLSLAPLPALHAAEATTSQEIDRETLVPAFQQRGCKVSTVDQYRNMLKPDGTIAPGLFSNKINHPNATAYDRMAQTWFEAIQAIFPPVKK